MFAWSKTGVTRLTTSSISEQITNATLDGQHSTSQTFTKSEIGFSWTVVGWESGQLHEGAGFPHRRTEDQTHCPEEPAFKPVQRSATGRAGSSARGNSTRFTGCMTSDFHFFVLGFIP